jgi:hypothetical protein
MITNEQLKELLNNVSNLDVNSEYVGASFSCKNFDFYAYTYLDDSEKDICISKSGNNIKLTQQQEQIVYNFLKQLK